MLVELILLGAVVAGGLAVLGVTRDKRKPVPRCRIQDAEEGRLVRIVGDVQVAQESIRAPLSSKEVLAYDVTVAWTRNDSEESFHTEGEAVPFVLGDDTGVLRIDPVAAKFELETRTAYQGGFLADLDTRVVEFLKARKIRTVTALGFNVGLIVREWVLEPGDTLAVIGIAKWENEPGGLSQGEPGYRDTTKRLRVIAPQGGQVLLTARPKSFGE